MRFDRISERTVLFEADTMIAGASNPFRMFSNASSRQIALAHSSTSIPTDAKVKDHLRPAYLVGEQDTVRSLFPSDHGCMDCGE